MRAAAVLLCERKRPGVLCRSSMVRVPIFMRRVPPVVRKTSEAGTCVEMPNALAANAPLGTRVPDFSRSAACRNYDAMASRCYGAKVLRSRLEVERLGGFQDLQRSDPAVLANVKDDLNVDAQVP
jgi:hypothetical protein